MSLKGQHVVPRGGKWGIRSTGAERVSRLYPTQEEAIQRARERARRDGGELYIHDRNGRIREVSSFSRDPMPSKR